MTNEDASQFALALARTQGMNEENAQAWLVAFLANFNAPSAAQPAAPAAPTV